MTSKERVLKAFSHEIPDRVPMGYFANPGIDKKLKAHFGLAENNDEGLRRALGTDFRGVGSAYTGPKVHPDIPERGVLVDNWGIHRRWVEHGTGGYWDYCDFPLEHADIEMARNWPMMNPDDFDYSTVRGACEGNKEYFVFVGGATGDIINTTGMLRGMEQTLVDLMTDDEVGLTIIDRRLAIDFEITRRTLEAAQGGVDALWLGEDLGTQIGPMISMELFDRHIRPRHQRFIDMARHYGAKVMFHSCGSSSWAFPSFIEMGVDVMDTLQPEAADMAPEYLKATFGRKLAFNGCISTAKLAQLSKEGVEKHCRDTLDIMMPGGGYSFAPTHMLQDNTPLENVLAMYEVGRTHGVY